MSSWAVISSALVVKAVIEFFGSPDFPEPKTEYEAVKVIQDWNGSLGNPLKLEPGDQIVKTDQFGLRKRYAGEGFGYRPDLDEFIPPKPGDGYSWNDGEQEWELNNEQ